MATYTTWQKVVDMFKLAADVESVGASQTALITAKSNLFQGYIRMIHKEDLTGTLDEIVTMTVANLVAEELKGRCATDDSEWLDVDYEHFKGRVTRFGAAAHSTIDAIRRGAIVLTQDVAERDLLHPTPIPGSANTSTGKVECYLPHEYKASTVNTYLMKITTAGRVDDGTAKYSVYVNNNVTAASTGNTCSDSWVELGYELYVRFRDGDQSGNEFILNDTFTVTGYPPLSSARTTGPYNLEFFSG